MGSSWWRPQTRRCPFVHSEVAFLVPRCGPPSPAVSEACRSFRPSTPLSVLGCSHRLPPEVTHRDLPVGVQKESRGMQERVLET